MSALRQIGQRLPTAKRWWHDHRAQGDEPGLPDSDGSVERIDAALVHFPYQAGFRTAVPTIYQPWDLQHLHLPDLFSRRDWAHRESTYRALCAQASVVVMPTAWGKADIIDQYDLEPDRVVVVPPGGPPPQRRVAESESLQALRTELRLPERFAYYPANTWPHKNHLRLLDALARLGAAGIQVPLVCSGEQTEFFRTIQRRIRRLGIHQNVQFVGFVHEDQLAALYQAAEVVVLPTLFEGWGLPVLEAFAAGTPVACSNVTSVPSLAGDAALTFDPRSEEQIAEAIARLWTDIPLASSLAARGLARARLFTWDRAARHLRAVYRDALGQTTAADRDLIASAPHV
jgi:glycosyltransferase involved in cell wall biosynthesis